MLDITLGHSPITIGEMIVILAFTLAILYFFTNCVARDIGAICWAVFCWIAFVALCIGVPIGLGIKLVMWVFP